VITVITIIEENSDHEFSPRQSYFKTNLVLLFYGAVTCVQNYTCFRNFSDKLLERKVSLTLHVTRLLLITAVLVLYLVTGANEAILFGFLVTVNLIFYAISTLLTLMLCAQQYINPP
jgi:hypothetical protein